MGTEQLFASFTLGGGDTGGLEIALRVEQVREATPVAEKIQPLPSAVNFVEGFMKLRQDVIPIVNLKKRLGITDVEYGPDAKVAVVNLFKRRYGLLFDDIREVFAAGDREFEPVDRALQTADKIISGLIHRDGGARTLEVLDLSNLFPAYAPELDKMEASLLAERQQTRQKIYARYVVFSFGPNLYGVPVELAREITFFSAIDKLFSTGSKNRRAPLSSSLEDIFQHGDIDGLLKLRGRTIPLIDGRRLLRTQSTQSAQDPTDSYGESSRVLVLSDGECHVGLIVEEVMAIEMIPQEDILPMTFGGESVVSGIYQQPDGRDIMLLNMEKLLCDRIKELKAMARLSKDVEKEEESALHSQGANLIITENSYLVVDISKKKAIQLKDVQEIIEYDQVLSLPGNNGYLGGVINLRGKVVPVVDLHAFYGYPRREESADQRRLVICQSGKHTVALAVSHIVTICKQEQYQDTGSLGNGLADKADTLDRIIAFTNSDGQSEHIMVVNLHNLVRNHLRMANA